MEMLANSDIIVGAALDHHRSKPVAYEMYGRGQTRRSAADDQNVVSRISHGIMRSALPRFARPRRTCR